MRRYLVCLCAEDEPFCTEPGLAASLRDQPPDQIIEALLKRKDAVTAEALDSFEAQQARGAWQNEVCETYYKAHARRADTVWPSIVHRKLDVKLRDMLSVPYEAGSNIREAAQERLGIEISGPPAHWGWTPEMEFALEAKRREMAVVFLIDRTYEQFLQSVVDAVLKVFDKYVVEDDLVGYYGVGFSEIFGVQPKGTGAQAATLREQIVGSVQKGGDPHVYSSIKKCLDTLIKVDDKYSKWLVVLTDTVDFECFNAKGVNDKQSPMRAEAAVSSVVQAMQELTGFNLVIIDAHGIANFNAKHNMWPTWHKMSQRLTDDVGDANVGLNIEATNVSEIDEAFERVAGAMTGGAAG